MAATVIITAAVIVFLAVEFRKIIQDIIHGKGTDGCCGSCDQCGGRCRHH